jgi:hypothetical protein
MYKNLSLVALVVILGLLAGHPASSVPSSPASPLIVRTAAFPNQTAPIPSTPLLTPTKTGLYRVSAYMTQIVPTTTSNVTSFLELTWTDDAGPEDTGLLGPVDLNANGKGYGNFSGGGAPGGVAIIEAVAGQPVNFSVGATNNVTNLGTYSVYFVVERLN